MLYLEPSSLTDEDLRRLIHELEPTVTGNDTEYGANLVAEAQRRDLDL